MPERFSLGAVIRQRRLELGWTQEELAQRISTDDEYVRQSEISRIENGKVELPRRERLLRLAEVLELPAGELLARSGWAEAGRYFSTPTRQNNGDIVVETVQPATLPEPVPDVSEEQPLFIQRSRQHLAAYVPDAMAEFRRALALLRSESDRLQRNRDAVAETERLFRQSAVKPQR
jgi:transcriptional regulator with XRE-family HTH domain